MRGTSPGSLGYIILGLLQSKERSGYAVMRVLRETALGRFSASPGAVYPALSSLERKGLVGNRTVGGSEERPRRVFRITDKGREHLREWLERPVSREEVMKGMEVVMLRFSLMEGVVEPERCLRFLDALERELAGYRSSLEAQHRELAASLALHGRLALEAGIGIYEAWSRWVEHARDQLAVEHG